MGYEQNNLLTAHIKYFKRCNYFYKSNQNVKIQIIIDMSPIEFLYVFVTSIRNKFGGILPPFSPLPQQLNRFLLREAKQSTVMKILDIPINEFQIKVELS